MRTKSTKRNSIVATITILATPATATAGQLPTLSFNPEGTVTEPAHEMVTFEIDSSLLAYVKSKDFTVTFTWNGQTTEVQKDTDLTFDVGDKGQKDSYTVTVTTNSQDEMLRGSNASSKSGDIIVG